MRVILAIIFYLVLIAFTFVSCNSAGSKTFCDTTCLKDPIRFANDNHPLKPFVYISPKDCKPDSVVWSYEGMGVNRKLTVEELFGTSLHLNKDYVRGVVTDTSYAWLLFNDCNTGRGYYLKIPFSKSKSIGRSNRALNNFDPKFSVAEGLVAYADPGNILIEEMSTGKKALLTFGRDIAPDFANIHNSIDSINITPTSAWAKYKVDNEWKETSKKFELK